MCCGRPPLPPGSATPDETQNSPFLLFEMVAGPRKLLGLFISVLMPPPMHREPFCESGAASRPSPCSQLATQEIQMLT